MVLAMHPAVQARDPIKAFCIDFNWGEGGTNGFAKPGPNSLPLPVSEYRSRAAASFQGNDRNIAVLARQFAGASLNYVTPLAGEARVKELQNLRWGLFIC